MFFIIFISQVEIFERTVGHSPVLPPGPKQHALTDTKSFSKHIHVSEGRNNVRFLSEKKNEIYSVSTGKLPSMDLCQNETLTKDTFEKEVYFVLCKKKKIITQNVDVN